MRKLEVVVAGGGIAGLASAFEILRRRPSTDLLVLEGASRLGGNIRSLREDGFVVEWGVNGFLDSVPETLALVSHLGLDAELERARDAAGRRFLWREGRLREIPLAPPRFLRSDILSVRGRLRVLWEPFAPRRPEGDETVFDFAARRIGREAAEFLVDPMVSGVYAGNARKLSLASTFPKMAAMERDHGSLVRAMLARRSEARRARDERARDGRASDGRARDGRAREGREREGGGRKKNGRGGPSGPSGVLTSFRDGMETLIERLGERLGADRVRLGRPVASISRVEGSGAFVLATQDGESFEAERVVIAVPAGAAARILRPLDEPMATDLAGIASAPLAVAAFAWPVSDLASVPDGFGFLVPRGQGLRILGCLWDSSVFSHRAPEGWVLVRAMLGGAHDPQAASLPDEEIVAIVRDELRKSMGIEAPPRRVHLFRHPLGIPQYEIGHGARLERIAGRLARLDPGGGRRLGLLGNAYRGVAVNQCVKDATDLAANWISGDGAWRREPIAGERPASAPHDPNG